MRVTSKLSTEKEEKINPSQLEGKVRIPEIAEKGQEGNINDPKLLYSFFYVFCQQKHRKSWNIYEKLGVVEVFAVLFKAQQITLEETTMENDRISN